MAEYHENHYVKLFKGTKISKITSDKLLQSQLLKRIELLENNIIKNSGDHFELTKDITIKGVNAAATIVTGQPCNGQYKWLVNIKGK